MEFFENNIPVGWFTSAPALISQVSQQGRVHSGNSSVNMRNGADLCQAVPIEGGCFYEFSFFAHGEGAQVGVTGTVTFVDANNNETLGLEIIVTRMNLPDSNRDFGYFRGFTTAAPANAVAALVCFSVNAQGNQSADIDDVSFALQ
jgi:hypothetical protein